MDGTTKQKIIVILGTNASGKSGLGLELAQKYNGEIISADSRQVYRGFDLCSGKVSPEEKAAVPHHMLDIVDVGTPFSVADYQKMVYALIPAIQRRGRIPFLVGGTGLYIDAITKGYVLREEESDPSFRQQFGHLPADTLWPLLSPRGQAYLSNNPSDARNPRRILRVLEKERRGLPLDPVQESLFDALQLGVTWPKAQLHRRIETRLSARMAAGMADEVAQYLKNNGDPAHLESLGLEYKHVLWLLQGRYTSVDAFQAEMARAIQRFAKRQMSWFRRNPDIHWLSMAGDNLPEACARIDVFMNQKP